MLTAIVAIATYVKAWIWSAIFGGRNANGVDGFGRGVDESLADIVLRHWGMLTWGSVYLSLSVFLYWLDVIS
jgi:hypothetical protein